MRWKLKTLQDEAQAVTGERITYEDITGATGLAASTLSMLANNRVARADLATMDKLLSFFSSKLGRPLTTADLLEWVPEKNGA